MSSGSVRSVSIWNCQRPADVPRRPFAKWAIRAWSLNCRPTKAVSAVRMLESPPCGTSSRSNHVPGRIVRAAVLAVHPCGGATLGANGNQPEPVSRRVDQCFHFSHDARQLVRAPTALKDTLQHPVAPPQERRGKPLTAPIIRDVVTDNPQAAHEMVPIDSGRSPAMGGRPTSA